MHKWTTNRYGRSKEHNLKLYKRPWRGRKENFWLALEVSALKALMRYLLKHPGHIKLKSTDNRMSWWESRAVRTLLHQWWTCKLVQTLQRTAWQLLLQPNECLSPKSAIELICVCTRAAAPTSINVHCSALKVCMEIVFITDKNLKELKYPLEVASISKAYSFHRVQENTVWP